MTERSQNKIRKQVEIWANDYDWFLKAFHGASLSWITNMMLHSFREVCENPSKYQLTEVDGISLSLAASARLKKELDEGIHREDNL